MITGRDRFNLYLFLAFIAIAAGGCQTHKDDKSKQLATLRIHLEAGPQDADRSVQVPIYRANPVQLQVQNEPFITELNVASAKVVDVLGDAIVRGAGLVADALIELVLWFVLSPTSYLRAIEYIVARNCAAAQIQSLVQGRVAPA